MDEARTAEARRLGAGVMLAAIDGTETENLLELLGDADRETLIIVIGSLAVATCSVLEEVPPERLTAMREYLAAWALHLAGT
jgi:hypothetical protein